MISYKFVKWKKINGPSSTNDSHFYRDSPVSVQARYFHWEVDSCKYLLSMDTVEEQFRETRLPGDLMKTHYSFIEMRGFLTLFNNVSLGKINIWRLKDFYKTKWEQMRSINISSYVSSNIYPLPVTILKSMRYIIFRIPEYDQKDLYFENGLYCYDWKDKIMIGTLDIDIEPDERCVVQSSSPCWDRRKYRIMG